VRRHFFDASLCENSHVDEPHSMVHFARMAKRRRNKQQTASGSKSASQRLPKAAETIGFTEIEEAFFREGASIGQPAAETFDDLEPAAKRGFWRRLFGGSPQTA
jgi:hypothetical protein